jgi:two-component system, OmpR family, sensor histidine kinase SenX3
MDVSGHRKSIIFFITFGVCLVILAITLNISWIVLLKWRSITLLILGILFFLAIIAGLVLNTIFLVREIRRNEQHDTFINAVTHELKTPVASIRLYLETLQRLEIDDVKRKEFYGIMLADSDRLIHTIEQVLRVGRTGRSNSHLNRSLADLGEIARECVALARTRHHLPPESIRCTESLPDGAKATVLVDLDEIKAALTNLLDNAIKYSGSEVRVMVEVVEVDAKRVAVRVKDQGVGIPENQLKRIFKRFYRIPGTLAMRVKGTGLGLFIVRSVAEKHGGRAFAESPGSGHGSTFTIQLPSASAK